MAKIKNVGINIYELVLMFLDILGVFDQVSTVKIKEVMVIFLTFLKKKGKVDLGDLDL